MARRQGTCPTANDLRSALTRSGEAMIKRYTATLFYWIMRKTVDKRIQPEVGDFRMFSRRAVLALRQLREQHREWYQRLWRIDRRFAGWPGLRAIGDHFLIVMRKR